MLFNLKKVWKKICFDVFPLTSTWTCPGLPGHPGKTHDRPNLKLEPKPGPNGYEGASEEIDSIAFGSYYPPVSHFPLRFFSPFYMGIGN